MKDLIGHLVMYEVAASSLGGKYSSNLSGSSKKKARALSHFRNIGTFSRA